MKERQRKRRKIMMRLVGDPLILGLVAVVMVVVVEVEVEVEVVEVVEVVVAAVAEAVVILCHLFAQIISFFFFQTRSHYVVPASLVPGWPKIHKDKPASAS